LRRAFTVVWEGVDGAGKTSLMNKVGERLREKGFKIYTYKTPSESETGRFARTYGNSPDIDPLTRMLLFLANTSDDSRRMREQVSKDPDFYFIDRYYPCSIVYGFALSRTRGVEVTEEDFKAFVKIIEKLGERVFLVPDLYVVVDAPEEERVRRLGRKVGQGGLEEELERNALLQENVRIFYKAFKELNPEKVMWIVNREGELEENSERIAAELMERAGRINQV